MGAATQAINFILAMVAVLLFLYGITLEGGQKQYFVIGGIVLFVIAFVMRIMIMVFSTK